MRTRQQLQILLRRRVGQRTQPVRRDLVAEDANLLADVVRAGVDVRPHQHGLHAHTVKRAQHSLHLPAFLAEDGCGRVIHAQKEGLRDVDPGAAALGVQHVRRQVRLEPLGDVAARAADVENRVRVLAHSHQVLHRATRAWHMKVRELRDRVPRALVDRARHFAALQMHDAQIEVRRRNRRGERLVAIADQQYEIGAQALQFVSELDHAEANRLCHRYRRRALELHVDFAVDLEAVFPQDLDGPAEAFEHHRSSGQNGEIQVGMLLNRPHHRLQPAIVGAVDQDHADPAALPLFLHGLLLPLVCSARVCEHLWFLQLFARRAWGSRRQARQPACLQSSRRIRKGSVPGSLSPFSVVNEQ